MSSSTVDAKNSGAQRGRGTLKQKQQCVHQQNAKTGPTCAPSQIEHIPLRSLKPNPDNPRRNDDAVTAVARSIQTYGFNNPIVTDDDLNIAAGHTRLKAAQELELETVPVIRVPGLVGSKFTGFSIADNKTAEIAEWDTEQLAKLIADLNTDVDFDLSSLGFGDTELTKLLDWEYQDEDERADEAPPLPEVAKTCSGDLWLLGDHRLLCGDATNRNDLKKLADGHRIDCLITDPPYGVDYHSRGRKKGLWGDIKNDNLDLDALETFLEKTLSNAAALCRPGATAYICHGISMAGIRIAFERAFLSAGFQLSSTIVWVKQAATMGWGDYREQHECLLYGWIGEGHKRVTDRTQTTVWHIDREGDYQHPTQKPVALISRALRNSTLRDEYVLDPFAGSGSTLIACQQLGRRCLSVEIEPRYCDVIVARWEKYTGKTAKLIRDGQVLQAEVCHE